MQVADLQCCTFLIFTSLYGRLRRREEVGAGVWQFIQLPAGHGLPFHLRLGVVQNHFPAAVRHVPVVCI